MTDHSVPKADGLNYIETKETAARPLRGDRPRSIRKRGHHRALKRGELWALLIEGYKTQLHSLEKILYCNPFDVNEMVGLSYILNQKETK